MDHIRLSSDDWGHPPIEIPYLCDGDRFHYDDQGFLTYPDRVGINVADLGCNQLRSFDIMDAAPFLQSWLWFGLLGETLRVGSRDTQARKHLDMEHFIKTVDDKRCLYSGHLLDAIAKASDPGGPPHYRNWNLSRLTACIQTAASFIQEATSAIFVAQGKEESVTEPGVIVRDATLTVRVLLACQVLCETLLEGFDINKQTYHLGSTRISLPLWNATSFIPVNNLLRQSGWMPDDIKRLPQGVIFRYHLSFYRPALTYQISQPEPEEDGRSSSNLSAYPLEPRHTHPQCHCQSVRASKALVDEAARKGDVVLFTYRNGMNGARDLQARVVSPDKDSFSYVAISHVRASGLGNSSENSLPHCRLSQVQSLVDQLSPDGTAPEKGLFWLDTLSLSTDRQLRKPSLALAWGIFEASAHVLVLDPPLYEHTFSSSEEAMIRIRYSSWKQRLWTLEEGFLAKSLVFRFDNKSVSLDDLLQDLRREFRDPGTRLRLIKDREPWPFGVFSRELRDDQLIRILKLYIDDVKIWVTDHSHHVREDTPVCQEDTIDREHLFKILRLGFLAGSKFRCLIEDDEYRDIPVVWMSLLKVYDKLENGPLSHSVDAVQRRLSLMNNARFLD